MINRFSPRTGLAVLSTIALLAFSPAASAFAEGPSFTSCDTTQGQERGQCVAQIAQDAQNDQANNGNAQGADISARDIVEDCQDDPAERGEGIGACVSDAIQALHDTGDEHAADVAATAAGNAGNGNNANAPGQRGPEGRPGNQSGQAGR